MATCALISQTKGQSQGQESKALSFPCLYGHHPPISLISSSSRWRLLAPLPPGREVGRQLWSWEEAECQPMSCT